jgi:hypothetical protein
MPLQDAPTRMPALNRALHGALQRAPPVLAAPGRGGLLLVGAGGTLGTALLERALAQGGFAPVMALAREPLASALHGFVPLRWRDPQAPPPAAVAPCSALVVFERRRHSNGRDDAFVLPEPSALLPWARALAAWGVRRLLVVVPHAPSMLPAALERGFASDDERQLAGLGFEQVVILRPAQAGHPADDGRQRLQRFADWWLSQLHWMVPAAQQALRTPRLAQLVVELLLQLDGSPPGTRVLPQALLAAAASTADPAQALRQWLRGPPG